MSTPAGQRDTYLTIWTESSTVPDSTGTGQMVPTYTKKCNAWGKVAPVIKETALSVSRAVNESWQAYHVSADATYTITIPYVSGIVTTDRITEASRSGVLTYNIAGPPIDTGADLIIPVAEVV